MTFPGFRKHRKSGKYFWNRIGENCTIRLQELRPHWTQGFYKEIWVGSLRKKEFKRTWYFFRESVTRVQVETVPLVRKDQNGTKSKIWPWNWYWPQVQDQSMQEIKTWSDSKGQIKLKVKYTRTKLDRPWQKKIFNYPEISQVKINSCANVVGVHCSTINIRELIPRK